MKKNKFLSVVISFCLALSCSLSCFASSSFMDDFWDSVLGFTEEINYPIDEDLPDQQEEGKKHNSKIDKELSKEIPGIPESRQDAGVKSMDLIVILDKSGSMYGLSKDTIGGFNSLLDEQRKKDFPVKVSMALFNHVTDVKLDRVDLQSVENLEESDYMPQGTTALLDAVGNTLSAFKGREEVNTEGNKVLVVIITDGLENASKEWSKDAVKKLVSDLQEMNGYEFAFLGADIDAVGVADGIGIRKENSIKFKKTSGKHGGVQSNFKAVGVMMDAVSKGDRLVESKVWRNSVVADD